MTLKKQKEGMCDNAEGGKDAKETESQKRTQEKAKTEIIHKQA
jgi:hypothetical protein